jgi:hypothetical protein
LEQLRDPWGQPYKFEFKAQRESRVLTLISSGPDKKPGSRDDFNETGLSLPYFEPKKQLIQAAGDNFHARTGGYVRDVEILKTELARQGADLDSWKDPWGHAYHYDFGEIMTNYTVTVSSAGPDGYFNTRAKPSDDDFALASIGFDYATELQGKIESAFNIVQYGDGRREFPQNVEELEKALKPAGIAWNKKKGVRYPFFLRESRHDWVMDRALERVPGTCEEMRFENGGVWISRDAR